MASEGQDRADALGWGRCPNRPKTFARFHTIPQKVTTVSICATGAGHPKGCPGPITYLASSVPRPREGIGHRDGAMRGMSDPRELRTLGAVPVTRRP